MLSWRITLGVLFTGILVGLCWLDLGGPRDGVWLLPLALILAALAGVEMRALLASGTSQVAAGPAEALWGPLLIVLASGAPAVWPAAPHTLGWRGLEWTLAGFLATFLMEATLAAWRYSAQGPQQARLAAAILRNTYVGLLMAMVVRLRMIAPGGEGMLALAALVATVKLSDIAAYTVGRLAGRHRLAPVLSPGKTWEGAAGGLLGACAGAWLLLVVAARWLDVASPLGSARWGVAGWLVYGLLVGSAGMVGDLFESLLKREAGVKDSSAWLPGFGGILDLLDSILLAAPVAYAVWMAAVITG